MDLPPEPGAGWFRPPMSDEERRRRRILTEIGAVGGQTPADDVVQGVCRFAVDSLNLSGCALLLLSQDSTLDVLADAGRHAGSVADLQFSLGEGPCLEACRSGNPVFATDLATFSGRWPMFSAAATDLGVRAEFSLPLQVGPVGLGTLDLSRDEPGMLGDDDLADALVAADIATDALLVLQRRAPGTDLAVLLEPAGIDRLVVHQATGMVSVQLDVSMTDALAALRAAAFRSEQSMCEVAIDVVERKVSFRD